MSSKEFFYKVSKDVFIISFITLVVFAILEWAEPGFVSYHISFNLLLAISLVSGIVIVLFKSR
jgi:hypothetical protein